MSALCQKQTSIEVRAFGVDLDSGRALLCLRGVIAVNRSRRAMSMFRPHNLTTLLVAVAMVVFVAAKAAHAFTIDPQSGTKR